MEKATSHPEYQGLEGIFAAIAGWVTKYRHAFEARNELRNCGPEEVARLAREMSLHPSELSALATKSEDSAALLERMLRALGVEPGKFADKNPAIMRDLQRLCVACAYKRRCAHDLDAGTASGHFHEYCPNAYTLDALIKTQ